MMGSKELFDVKGRVAIITGATGAFGQVAAEVLGDAGCKLVLAGGNERKLSELTALLDGLNVDSTSVIIRPDSEANCKALVDAAVAAYGRLDILVVASGMNDVAPIAEMELKRFEAVMDANVTGSWLMCQAAGRQMLKQGEGGKVVLVSSARGKLGHPAGYSAYCASKAATDGLTKALGCEWGKDGITVNAIAPTVFRSPLTAWMFEDTPEATKVREGFLARVPLNRLGEPDDLAGPLLFLCSPASNFYTGHILYADGGYTAG